MSVAKYEIPGDRMVLRSIEYYNVSCPTEIVKDIVNTKIGSKIMVSSSIKILYTM